MDILAKPSPRERNTPSPDRGYAPRHAKTWLAAGWRDFKDHNMEASLLYGLVVFLMSAGIVVGLFMFKLDYILFPALAAFMVIGPTLAVGLYEKSRRIQTGEPVGIVPMINVRSRSKGQKRFVGLILTLWVLLWLRAGVLLYAMFFGMQPFPGLWDLIVQMLTQPAGWGLLITGTLFGGLFAAFAFATTVISVPMLVNEDTDAFTAMGSSMVLCWHNLPVMLAWGAIVVGVFVLCVLTGLLGLIIAFPVLGHATWHVYSDIRKDPSTPVLQPAITDSDLN